MLETKNCGIFIDSLGFGLTDCDPYLLSVEEFPNDMNFFCHRSEYWFVDKNCFKIPPSVGDVLTFIVRSDGNVDISNNDENVKTLECIDTTKKLYGFWNLYGHTVKVRILPFDIELQKVIYPIIPEITLDKLIHLFANIQSVLEARLEKNREKYDKALMKLPLIYRDYYHYLASLYLQFIVILFGNSHVNYKEYHLSYKSDWRYVWDDFKCYQKVIIILRIYYFF